ncbi:MAG: hypothetical protein AAGD10_11820 [Myxococcota bacterium]
MKRASWLLAWALFAPSTAGAVSFSGASLPEKVRPAGEDGRYRSLESYDRTLRWFRRVYGRSEGLFFQPIRGAAGVDGVHIHNLRAGRRWDTINVYEAKKVVHILVLPHR